MRKCKVVINGKEVLACKTAVDRDMTVYTGNKKEERAQILHREAADRQNFPPEIFRKAQIHRFSALWILVLPL